MTYCIGDRVVYKKKPKWYCYIGGAQYDIEHGLQYHIVRKAKTRHIEGLYVSKDEIEPYHNSCTGSDLTVAEREWKNKMSQIGRKGRYD